MGRPTIEASEVRRERSWRRDKNIRIDLFSYDLDKTVKMNLDEKVVNMTILFLDEQLCCLGDFDLRSFTTPNKPHKVHISFKPNNFGKFGLNHPNCTQIRVLGVNPTLHLAQKVHPPFIYMRGDGRLNQHQSNKSIYYLFVFIYFYLSLPLYRSSRSSLFFRTGGCEFMRS